jgi:hypothetical protein
LPSARIPTGKFRKAREYSLSVRVGWSNITNIVVATQVISFIIENVTAGGNVSFLSKKLDSRPEAVEKKEDL